MSLQHSFRFVAACTASAALVSGLIQSAPAVAQQTPPPKRPAAAAPAPSNANAAGAQRSGKPLMTREELRACLKRNDELQERSRVLEEQDRQMATERSGIEADLKVVREEQAKLEARAAEIKALEPKVKAFREKVTKFQARAEDVSAMAPGDRRDRANQALLREQLALEAERKALEDERSALVGPMEAQMQAYRTMATAADERAQAWNQRKSSIAAESSRVIDDGKVWQQECGDRPYREDDERAIRAGK